MTQEAEVEGQVTQNALYKHKPQGRRGSLVLEATGDGASGGGVQVALLQSSPHPLGSLPCLVITSRCGRQEYKEGEDGGCWCKEISKGECTGLAPIGFLYIARNNYSTFKSSLNVF